MFDPAELVKLSVALLAIVDIPGNIPMLLQQTASMSQADKRLTALVAGIATAAILLVFTFFGEAILNQFGVTIDAFRILGGLVVLLIGLDLLGLLGANGIDYGGTEDPNPLVTGVFPMAVPLFAGPGAITAVMIYAHEDEKHPFHEIHMMIIVLGVCAAIVVGLMLAGAVSRLIGEVTQTILNRLLGMIVGALGVEFILEGLVGFFGLGVG